MHMRGSYGLGGYQSRSSLSGDEGEAYRHGYNGYGGRGGGGSGRSVTMFGEQQRGVPAGRPIGGYGLLDLENAKLGLYNHKLK